MIKFVVTGPESSGKTTLSKALGHEWRAVHVNEVAREYLAGLQAPYGEHDLLVIAKAQLRLEDELAAGSELMNMVCDTDLITVRIWSEEKYGRCDPWIIEHTQHRLYHHWLLCSPEGIPWEPDPLRENPHDRERLFQRHLDLLEALGKPYSVLLGDPQDRLHQALGIARKVELDHNR